MRAAGLRSAFFRKRSYGTLSVVLMGNSEKWQWRCHTERNSGFVQLNGILSDITDVTVATNVYIDPTISNPYWIYTFGSADDPASAPGTKYFGMLTDGGGNSRVSITNDRWSAEQNASKGSSFSKGVWKNVAVTLSGATMTFYEDGNKIAEKSNVTLF